jgi:predicted nucleic acid-binding protein
MRVYIDTSAFYALLDRDDANHQRAKDVWANLLKNENTLITSNYVLVETFALIQHRLGIEAVRGFQNDILPLVNIEFVAAELHRSGVSALLSASRRNLSLVDCVSFEMMRTLEIRTAFAFDPHFKEQGFYIQP